MRRGQTKWYDEVPWLEWVVRGRWPGDAERDGEDSGCGRLVGAEGERDMASRGLGGRVGEW